VILGLDIGGSSSRALLSQDGRTVADATAPGANVSSIDPALVEERLTSLIHQLGSPRPVACCAGAAGSEVEAGKRFLEGLLARLLPGCRVLVVHDTRLVLAAAGLDSGIALIAGTGSVAYGRDPGGRELRVGGWGWILGDEGGGAWIAREAMRELMRGRDAGEPIGPLGEAMLAASATHDVLELAGRLEGFREAAQWAVFARVVLESVGKDRQADRIVERAAEALAALVEQVRAGLSMNGPVVMAGGVLANFPALESAVRERIGPSTVLHTPPVEGAVRIAQAL
jgi:N-acetylglucosamine kinase-like BadF-type ATPase